MWRLHQSKVAKVKERRPGALVFGDEFVPIAIGIFVTGCHFNAE
jgi:hypothetical protein